MPLSKLLVDISAVTDSIICCGIILKVVSEERIMGLVKTRRLAAMQKQQRAKAGMKVVKPCKLQVKSFKTPQYVLGAHPLGIVK